MLKALIFGGRCDPMHVWLHHSFCFTGFFNEENYGEELRVFCKSYCSVHTFATTLRTQGLTLRNWWTLAGVWCGIALPWPWSLVTMIGSKVTMYNKVREKSILISTYFGYVCYLFQDGKYALTSESTEAFSFCQLLIAQLAYPFQILWVFWGILLLWGSLQCGCFFPNTARKCLTRLREGTTRQWILKIELHL